MSTFRWHCADTEAHLEHRIDGDGYYGPGGYVCTGDVLSIGTLSLEEEALRRYMTPEQRAIIDLLALNERLAQALALIGGTE